MPNARTRKALQRPGKPAPHAPMLVVVSIGMALTILLVLSVFLSREFLRHLEDLSNSATENPQWSLAQVEVDHLKLQAATQRALAGGSLDQVRLRFDIFYGRMGNIQESRMYAHLRASRKGAALIAEIQGRLNKHTPKIDGPDQALRDALPDITEELAINALDVRSMALESLASYARVADARKDGLTQSLGRLSWVVMALLLALALTALMIGKLYFRGQVLTVASVAAKAELTIARDDALAGERAKANLLTVMSHEMRTPLNGVLGSLELLEATRISPEQNSYLHAMRISGELLLHHVNEVLELSQLEAGAALEQAHNFDLAELMTGLVVSQQATARAHGNSLKLHWRLNKQSNVLGRPLQIQQVMLNLIGNALKFTSNGIVTVEVERQADSELVEFRISDTGVGIAAADLERIFEDFVTLDISYGRTSEGTGLGLAITRRIVGTLGGVIEAKSELGKGSMFRVTLPLPMAMEGQKKAMPKVKETQPPKHLLVVEDNDINRVLMAKTLQRLGHQVTTAAGGAEAVEAAAGSKFDLILMDISMPGVDGTEACRRIRAQKLAEGVNIVALTAHAAADDHSRILESGFAEVATKPISRNDLAQLITRRSVVKSYPEIELENSD